MRRSLAAFFLIPLLFSVASHVQAAVCQGFRPARQDMRGSPPGLARPIAALPGDFDGDGIPDLAVVNRYIDGSLHTGSVSVLKRTQTGDYLLVSTQMCAGGATAAVTADFNKDSLVDVGIVHNAGLGIFLGNGAGGFQPHTTIALGLNPIHLSAADMDTDGNVDLVVVQQYIGQPQGRVTTLRGNGSGGFSAMTPAPVGQSPRGGALGDFNRDGKLDVVTGSTIADTVTFLPGLGTGNFGTPVTSPITATAYYLTAGHFNGDGIPDLAVTGQTNGKRTVILRGEGDGIFTTAGFFSAGSDSRNPVLCDFDRNGHTDVAVANAGTSNVVVLSGSGNFGFSLSSSVGTDNGPAGAVSGDINFDGYCDVVTANEGSDSVSILMGGGLGNSLGAPTIPTGTSPLGAAAADFNLDGRIDLATVNRDDGTITIFRGNGEGWMFESQTAAVGELPGAIAAADFNQDGAMDLVVANQGLPSDVNSDTINVLYNDTVGGFYLEHTLTAGDIPLDVKTGDFNGDGLPDIVVANSRSDKVTFYFAEPLNSFSNVRNIRIGDAQRTLVVDDYNADGVPDVAVGLMGQNAVVTLLTTPSGWQKGPTVTLPGAATIDHIAGADLNGDAYPDLVAVSQPGDPLAPGLLTSLLGTGPTASFTVPWPAQSTGVRPEAVAVLEVDGAGSSDLVVANRFDNDIMVFKGDGNGHFVPGERYGSGNDPFYLTVADFNGDTRMDVVTVNFGGNSTSMLLNNAAASDLIQDFAFTSPQGMSWGSVPGASSYNIYRGSLDVLDSSNYGQCLAGGLLSSTWSENDVPAGGQGYFYLITSMLDGSEGPLGYDSECLKRPNYNPCQP
jgi:hypothetical protein